MMADPTAGPMLRKMQAIARSLPEDL
jgi:hypothetical protein